MQVDFGKLATILMVLVGVSALTWHGDLDSELAASVYGLAAGYTFGNGRLAVTGKEPQPMIRRRPDDQ